MCPEMTNIVSTVSGNYVAIPARIRHELDINDGDHLRWQLEDDGSIRLQVVDQQGGTSEGFTGYGGTDSTDVTGDHDSWGTEGG